MDFIINKQTHYSKFMITSFKRTSDIKKFIFKGNWTYLCVNSHIFDRIYLN